MNDRYSVHPSYDELFDRLLRNFTGHGIPKAEHAESLTVQIVGDREQAQTGGLAPIGIPVFQYCPSCGGKGTESFFPCVKCGGRGVVEGVGTMTIVVPARPAPGTVFEVSLEPLGIRNLFLRAYVSL